MCHLLYLTFVHASLCTRSLYLMRDVLLPMSECDCGLNIFYVIHLLCFPGSRARPRCPTNCRGWLGPEQASWHPEPGPRAILTRTSPKFTHYFNPVSFHAPFGYIWFCPNSPVSLAEKIKLLNISRLVMHTQTAWIRFTCLGTKRRKALVWTRPCEATSWGGPPAVWENALQWLTLWGAR